jgi:hypothetical protein
MKNITITQYPALPFHLESQTSAKIYSKSLINPCWLTGFSDAESSFIVSIYKDKEYACGWQVQASYKIQLHIKDLPILQNIQKYFGVGTICIKEDRNSAVYTVKSLYDLKNVIIPHFIKYPLLTQKLADFLLFQMVVEIKEKKEHLTLEGLSKIISIRASMNKGLTDILKSNFPNITPVERPIIYLPNTLDLNQPSSRSKDLDEG